VYVIQWAELMIPRSSGCALWRDYGQCLPEYDSVEEVTVALARFRRWEAVRPNPVRLRAVKRIVVEEWLVGL
jgi:hypothetical protein